MNTPRLHELMDIFEQLWPASFAESWDSVGLAVGDRHAPVGSILFALDPMDAVIAEAVERKVDLLFTHHPLLLKPVGTLAAHTLKGGAVHSLISNGIAQFNAHTNADSAVGGVSDVLADVIELKDRTPLTHDPKHPDGVGIGRVGTLPEPLTVTELAQKFAATLPATHTGLRIAGDPGATVSRVAVLGGAGDSLFEQVRATDAEVYVTSDLRHHPATEARDTSHRAAGTPHLIDIPHWSAESPWMTVAAGQVESALRAAGFAVDICVSTVRTDPWAARIHQDVDEAESAVTEETARI